MQFLALHKLFEQQVVNHPENIAITYGEPCYDSANPPSFNDTHYSYSQLNSLANQVAHLLQEYKIEKGDVVAIALERHVYTFAALLACSKLGAAFLLIDTHYPLERIQYLLTDAKPKLSLTEDCLLPTLESTLSSQNFLSASELKKQSEGKSEQNLDLAIKAEDIAYIIYTSGTTGNPKGACIRHTGLHNWINEQTRILNIQSQDIILQFAPLSFDPSIWDMIMAFGHGASLYLTPREVCVDAHALNTLFQTKAITAVTVTPIVLSWLKPNANWKLRFLVSTGEAFRTHYAKELMEKGVKLYNGYGPSETTIGVTLYEVTEKDIHKGEIPIGKAITNTQIYILDEQLKEQRPGKIGEIYISGYLAESYLNNPTLSSEKFIELAINGIKTRAYKTGDLACVNAEDGLLYFKGRNDKQIKIQGKRIELEEIQAILLKHPSLQEAYVTTFALGCHDKAIVAYYIPKQNQALPMTDYLNYCNEKLPKYMVPSSFMQISTLPLTANGKIDEKQLPKPIRGQNSTQLNQIRSQPINAIQQKLKEVWQAILEWTEHDQPLSIKDDFFISGGASIMLSTLQLKIRKTYNIIYPINLLVQDNTIEAQASYIAKALEERKQTIALLSSGLFQIDKNSRPRSSSQHPLDEKNIPQIYKSLFY